MLKANIRQFSHLAFICSKLTTETLEFKVNNFVVFVLALSTCGESACFTQQNHRVTKFSNL